MAKFLDAAFPAIYEHLRARGDITPVESKALSDALMLYKVYSAACASLHDFRAKESHFPVYSRRDRKR